MIQDGGLFSLEKNTAPIVLTDLFVFFFSWNLFKDEMIVHLTTDAPTTADFEAVLLFLFSLPCPFFSPFFLKHSPHPLCLFFFMGSFTLLK